MDHSRVRVSPVSRSYARSHREGRDKPPGVGAMSELDVSRLLEGTRFLFLMRFASAAIRTLKEAPERIAKIRQFVDDIQARCGFVPTSGKYDLITVFQGDDQQAYQFNLYLRSRPEFDVVDMLRLEAGSPQEYMKLIQPLTVAR
jgi:uncharacterized protein with GYD domain